VRYPWGVAPSTVPSNEESDPDRTRNRRGRRPGLR
jgi:hypothetical protein